jgi:hypothetical protein
MAKIVISYSRRDRRRVRRIVSILRDEYGYERVWCDENFYAGQVWWQEILQEIGGCHIFVYVMSPPSLTSPYCLAELEEARRLRKHILPVKLRRGRAAQLAGFAPLNLL